MILYRHFLTELKDGWHWYVERVDGEPMCESRRGYSRKGDAARAWKRFLATFGKMTVA
jgi:hypothetical protein